MSRTSSEGPQSLLGRLVMGSVFALPGLYIVGIGTGVVEADPSTVHAPYWLITMIGGMFAVAGGWLFSHGTRVEPFLRAVVGPAIMIGMLTALHWVAFGPGARECSGGFSIPFVSSWGRVGDNQCRLAFGYGAVLFDGIFVAIGMSHVAKKWLTGPAAKVVEGVGNAVLLLALLPLVPLLLLAGAGTAIAAGFRKMMGRE